MEEQEMPLQVGTLHMQRGMLLGVNLTPGLVWANRGEVPVARSSINQSWCCLLGATLSCQPCDLLSVLHSMPRQSSCAAC